MKSEGNESSADKVRDRSPLNSNTDKAEDVDSNVSGSGAKDKNRERDRDRQRRGDRPSRFGPRNSSASPEKDRGNRKSDRRIFVSNIAYEFRWQELKDLFRSEVGKVSYVELFNDENDKPRGCGIVEFENPESVAKAVEKMHRYELRGRKLVVKEDYGVDRDKYGHPIKGGGGGNRGGGGNTDSARRREIAAKWEPGPLPLASLNRVGSVESQKWGANTFGLSPQFLESLCITGPLVTRVFVANLDYKVDEKKLKEVFRLAGKIVNVELSLDKEGKSRGFGIVEYEHPVEAVQAISMFHNQMLYDRKLTVRMDRVDHKNDAPPKLPEGLKSIGMGLGSCGTPLQDVTRSLPTGQQMSSLGGLPGTAATLGTGLGLGNSGAALQAGLAGVGGLGAGALVGGGGGELGLGSGLGASAAFGGSGLGAGLSSAAAGLGQGLTTGAGSLAAGNSFGAGLGGVNASSYLGGSGVGYGSQTSGLVGGSYGARDFDVSALGSGVAASSYGAGIGERDYRGASAGGGAGYANGPGRGGTGARSTTIMVKNLPPTATWQMLRDKFREVGEVEFAEIRGKDIGLIRFRSDWDAERAVHMMDRTRYEGRTIDVGFF